MNVMVDGLPVYVVEHGGGIPLLALHGWMSSHREMAGNLERVFGPEAGYRRIYPDLPGMGRTPAPERIASADDVLEVLLGLVDQMIGEQPFLMAGHSYGGYLARAIANRRPQQVAGLAVFCPLLGLGSGGSQPPEHGVIHADGDLGGILAPEDEAEFRAYYVVQTPETLRRFQEELVPDLHLADTAALARIGERWLLRDWPESGPAYAKPTLIMAGRQDSTVGYADQWSLLDHYPRATFAVLDRAGHALPQEQERLFTLMVSEWLERVQEHQVAAST